MSEKQLLEDPNEKKFDTFLAEAIKSQPTGLPLNFSNRVARATVLREARISQGQSPSRMAFALSLLGLLFLIFFSFRTFPPHFLTPLKEGPFPLILTAVFCLLLGNFLGKHSVGLFKSSA